MRVSLLMCPAEFRVIIHIGCLHCSTIVEYNYNNKIQQNKLREKLEQFRVRLSVFMPRYPDGYLYIPSVSVWLFHD